MGDKENFVLGNGEQEYDFTGTEVLSVNGRTDIESMKKKYPNIEIIVGKLMPEDKPVKLNLLQMEDDKNKIFDAATETILGQRIEKLEKPIKFPFPFVTFILGAMASAAFWLFFSGFFQV